MDKSRYKFGYSPTPGKLHCSAPLKKKLSKALPCLTFPSVSVSSHITQILQVIKSRVLRASSEIQLSDMDAINLNLNMSIAVPSPKDETPASKPAPGEMEVVMTPSGDKVDVNANANTNGKAAANGNGNSNGAVGVGAAAGASGSSSASGSFKFLKMAFRSMSVEARLDEVSAPGSTASPSPVVRRSGRERELFKLPTLTRKTPAMRVEALTELINSLVPDVSCTQEVEQEIRKNLNKVRISVCGDKEKGEKVLADKEYVPFVETVVKCGYISAFMRNVGWIPFEERKVATTVFKNLLRRKASEGPVVAYIERNENILIGLLDGYKDRSTALVTGDILRECIRFQSLAKIILNADSFFSFFDYLKTDVFEVSTDSHQTMKDLLLVHAQQSCDFLMENYDRFFENYHPLFECDNYVVRMQSTRLLGSVLLDRRFHNVMREYVESPSNLKRIILLMDSQAANLQLEAFHIFKIFVANPSPPAKVSNILMRNNNRLVKLLGMIDGKNRYGEDFDEEKAFLIKVLTNINDPRKPSEEESESIASSSDSATSFENSNSDRQPRPYRRILDSMDRSSDSSPSSSTSVFTSSSSAEE